jgi:outer membrane protein TolC
MRRLLFMGALVLVLPHAIEAQEPGGGPRVVIGIVEEGPSPGDDVVPMIEEELQRLLRRHTVVFKRDPAFNAGWDPAQFAPALSAALTDPEVEIVLAVGALVSQAAGQAERTKPVVTTFVQRPDLFDIHDSTNDRAVDSNLVITIHPLRVGSDLRELETMYAVDTVALAVGMEYAAGLGQLADDITGLHAANGATIVVWPIDAGELPDSVPVGVDAVLLGPTPRLAPVQRQGVIEMINSYQVGTFSLEGLPDVERGALLTRSPDMRTQKARRAALNLSELVRGRHTTELSVFLGVDPDLYLNGATAAQIGYSPRISTLVQATIIHEDAMQLAEAPLALADAQRMVQETNVTLAIVTAEVETSRKNRQIALSPLLPQIVAVPNYRALDPQALDGLIAEQAVNLDFQASQMIYDDQLVSNYRSAKRLEESSQQNRETRRLDVIGNAGEAFLDLVLARLLYRVTVDNLRLSLENLGLARHRLDVGYSGPDEVFRWEAEVAKGRGEVLQSQTLLEEQRIALNQILGVDQTSRWRAREIQVDTTEFLFAGVNLSELMTTQQELRTFRELMVDFAVLNAPEVKAVDRRREAQSIQVGQRQRRWFLPAFSMNLDYRYQPWREPDLTGASRTIPVFSVQATYPLFLGAERAHSVGQTKSQLERLTQQQLLTSQLVERRTRAAIRRLEASFPNIRFTQIQADRARRNLVVVQDRYAQGLVNVTDLVSAQNETFTAEQGAAAANYLFLIDLNAFERSIAWFEGDQSPEASAEFGEQLRAALENPTGASLNPPPPQ